MTMTINEMIKGIEASYAKYFKGSRIFVSYTDNLYRSIGIKCFLASDKTENPSNYWDNDMLTVTFSIQLESGQFAKGTTADSETPEIMVLENWHKHYMIKPESRNLCYSSKSLSFRKTKGDANKMISSLDKFFKKLHDALAEELANDNITDNWKPLAEKYL
jgi:hypothetical protein